MTSFKEIERMKRDPDRARALAKSLLDIPDLTSWEQPFLEDMQSQKGLLSTRQAEKLLEIRDQNAWASTIGGFSVRSLLNACWEARYDLNDEDDITFIEGLKARGSSTARHREACHLLICARALRVIDS
jgi:hypothetical protein